MNAVYQKTDCIITPKMNAGIQWSVFRAPVLIRKKFVSQRSVRNRNVVIRKNIQVSVVLFVFRNEFVSDKQYSRFLGPVWISNDQ